MPHTTTKRPVTSWLPFISPLPSSGSIEDTPYTITQKNAALALPKRSLSRGVAEEIQNAIAAGKEVTVHEKAISAYGFSGFGYTVIDPETGVGGYLIEGKGNGALAYFLGIVVGSLFWASLEFAITAPAFLHVMIPFIALALAAIIASISFLPEFYRGCFLQGLIWSTYIAGLAMIGGAIAFQLIGQAAFTGSLWLQLLMLLTSMGISIPKFTSQNQVETCLFGP